MRSLVEPAALSRRPALEPGDTLIDALDNGVQGNRTIERRRNMREGAKRAASAVSRGGRGARGVVNMPRADHDTAERVGGRRDSRPHHRNRRKKLHQNRDHNDRNQMSQPLPHSAPTRIGSGYP